MLEAEALVREFGRRTVVAGASLAIAPGETVALLGPSGCGKSTLLQMLGLLDRPGAGRVLLDGTDVWAAGSRARADLRLRRIGFVFQQNSLFEHMTARENVALPAWKLHGQRSRALEEADVLLARLGLAERASEKAALLSVGEAQRVAIARALINGPAILLADEPTGSLDSESTASVLATLDSVRDAGAALLLVTHAPDVAARSGRILTMRDGRIFG